MSIFKSLTVYAVYVLYCSHLILTVPLGNEGQSCFATWCIISVTRITKIKLTAVQKATKSFTSIYSSLPIALADCGVVWAEPPLVLSATEGLVLLLFGWGGAELELAWGALPPVDLKREGNHQFILLTRRKLYLLRHTKLKNCTHFGAALITRWRVCPSLIPCCLSVSPSFRIFPVNISTSWSCLASNLLDTSCLNWTNETGGMGKVGCLSGCSKERLRYNVCQ